ncbi:hypothetical protein N4T04_000734 [Salmonella enterica]|nr:hypothetical protein [Salmonella enterica]
MYTTIRNSALAMVACFSYIAHASTHPPLIITRGAGGDASGATVIHDNWRHGTPDLVNLTDIPIDKIRPEKYSCVLIIGQGAIKEMLLANNASAILSGKTVGSVYSSDRSEHAQITSAIAEQSEIQSLFYPFTDNSTKTKEHFRI